LGSLPRGVRDGTRVAIWPVINVEEWDFDAPLPRTVLPPPQGGSLIPDVANYGWFDYGNRVGFWRMKRLLDAHGIRATLSVNAAVCDRHPAIVTAAMEADWELLAHGYLQRALHHEPDERAVIRRSIDRLAEFSGVTPRGWLGPGLAETHETLRILQEEGVEYVCDWCNDDRPYVIRPGNPPLVALPYSLETHDITMFAVQHQPAGEWFQRGRDQFETLYAEGASGTRVLCLASHPYLSGVPHRIGYFEQLLAYLGGFEDVSFVTGEELLDWHLDTPEGV
jgi:peptidoglycan/xylan/chitin deacetylase (PgdA/CDA1 family)